jgi:carbonic anhydrase/acetyltransferase-like protein (isoleucine patch superfamily)
MPITSYRHFTPQLAAGSWIHSSAQVIGDVVLGADVSIWCNAVLRGDVNHIRVGAGSNIQDLSMCHVSHKTPAKPQGSPLIIGSLVTVGHGVILHGCEIGDECLIGMGSIVMEMTDGKMIVVATDDMFLVLEINRSVETTTSAAPASGTFARRD